MILLPHVIVHVFLRISPNVIGVQQWHTIILLPQVLLFFRGRQGDRPRGWFPWSDIEKTA
jgi:hypothetical protein